MANGTISEILTSPQFLKDQISAKDRLLICGIRRDLKYPATQNQFKRKSGGAFRSFFKKSKTVLG